MKNQLPSSEDIKEMLRELQRMNNERNSALRSMFGKYIKQNFMIRIKEEIKTSSEFKEIMSQCYNLDFYPIVAFGLDDVDFDICLNIAMINYYLMLPISNDEKSKSENYKNDKYIADLKHRVILQCKLRQLIQNYEERNFLSARFPINFSMHCIVNFIRARINENIKNKNRSTVPNANFKINTLRVMLKTIRSILLLIECDDCGSAFSLLRTLIEAIAVYMAIFDDENASAEYYKFMDYRGVYEATGQYPEEFEQIVPKNCNKQNFLNYGWLDKLEDKRHKYVFSEVIDCNKKMKDENKKSYLTSYKYCCKFAHGNYLNQAIPSDSFIWIQAKAGEVLINISKQFSYIFQEKTVYNGIDLEELLIKDAGYALRMFNILQNAPKSR